ncbi:hypothetical protein [Amycolatopsis sp. NPDC057786]|uniref:hypothetical protein n=1 Tax=Amycolatopsis sp. NPDC057786 TaxID=3346250 RepID=UPI00366DE94C
MLMLLLAEEKDDTELLEHLLLDKLWKMGIVVVAVIIAIVAMVIIYRKAGRR